MTDLAAAHAPVWSVVNFQQDVLGHRLTLPEALRRILEVVLELDWRNDSGRYWPLFMVAATPLDGEGWRPIDGGLHRKDDLTESLHARGERIDVRDLDLPCDWPADLIERRDALDPEIQRRVCERYAADLAAGTPVTVVVERTRLTHIDELQLWAVNTNFNFQASSPGCYEDPGDVDSFDSSIFREPMVLSWCFDDFMQADAAWGVTHGIDIDLPVEPYDRSARHDLDIRLEPRFIAQIDELLAGASPDLTPVDAEILAIMLEEKRAEAEKQRVKEEKARAAAAKPARQRGKQRG
jgi:hypothetical protein